MPVVQNIKFPRELFSHRNWSLQSSSLIWKYAIILECFSSLVVSNGLYTVHSYNTPYSQENSTLNYCWRAHNGALGLGTFCQVFKARIPGLYMQTEDRNRTVSFESVCLPGYYIRQKNYKFILEKRDGSNLNLFGEKSGFFILHSTYGHLAQYTRTQQLIY